MEIKDSGERTEFETGAVRDMHSGKGRMDLLPWKALIAVSQHCEEGALKYGRLQGDWKKMLRDGFSECFRVLDADGVLIFKWSEVEIPLHEILPLSPYPPLFGHRSGKHNHTHWLCFMKPRREEGF